MEKLANHWPAVRLTVTSQIRSLNLRCSTIATGPILGRVAPFPPTLTVSGPLSARNPSSCFRRLKRGNPTRRQLIPCFRFLPYSRQLEGLVQVDDGVLLGILRQLPAPRSDHIPDPIPSRSQGPLGEPFPRLQASPELVHRPVVGEAGIAGVPQKPGFLPWRGPQCHPVGLPQEPLRHGTGPTTVSDRVATNPRSFRLPPPYRRAEKSLIISSTS